MRFSDLNWMDVENYLRQDDRIMVVLGATEQHGYLSLLTDSKIPMAFADAASQKTGVLIAPESNFGSFHTLWRIREPSACDVRLS